MKRVTVPKVEAIPEIADYYCDFTGQKFRHGPHATLELKCGYPTERDMLVYRFDLSEEALAEVALFLRSRIYPRKLVEHSLLRSFDDTAEEINEREFAEDGIGDEILKLFPRPEYKK